MRYDSVDFTRMLIRRTWTLLLVQTHPPQKKNQKKKAIIYQKPTTILQSRIML